MKLCKFKGRVIEMEIRLKSGIGLKIVGDDKSQTLHAVGRGREASVWPGWLYCLQVSARVLSGTTHPTLLPSQLVDQAFLFFGADRLCVKQGNRKGGGFSCQLSKEVSEQDCEN